MGAPPGLLRLVLLLLLPGAAALRDFSAEYKTKSACENQELKLHCHESKFINIYSATYGRLAHEKDICSTEADHAPPFDCLSYTALDVLSKRCYGKQRCKIVVNHNDFGSPCLPGVKKYLNVNYTCVPKIILTAVDPMVANLNPTLNQKDSKYDVNFDPKGSRSPKKDGTIVSSSLATFAYIRDHPERAALLFVSSVCIGLVFTLCALVVRVSCTNDFQRLHRIRTHFEPGSDQADGNSENDEEEDSSDSDFPDELTRFCRTPYSGYNSTEAAELAERIERRDQLWRNNRSGSFHFQDKIPAKSIISRGGYDFARSACSAGTGLYAHFLTAGLQRAGLDFRGRPLDFSETMVGNKVLHTLHVWP